MALPDRSLSGRSVLDDLLRQSSAPPAAAAGVELVRDDAQLRARGPGVSFQIEIGARPRRAAVAVPLDERNLPAGRLVLMALRDRVLPVAAALFAEFIATSSAPNQRRGELRSRCVACGCVHHMVRCRNGNAARGFARSVFAFGEPASRAAPLKREPLQALACFLRKRHRHQSHTARSPHASPSPALRKPTTSPPWWCSPPPAPSPRRGARRPRARQGGDAAARLDQRPELERQRLRRHHQAEGQGHRGRVLRERAAGRPHRDDEGLRAPRLQSGDRPLGPLPVGRAARRPRVREDLLHRRLRRVGHGQERHLGRLRQRAGRLRHGRAGRAHVARPARSARSTASKACPTSCSRSAASARA
jgi:hypothetical protein